MIEHAQCPSVVSIPWLHNIRVSLLKVFDQSNDFHPVGNHIQRVSLHHTLPNMENIILTVPSSQDKRGVVTIAV